jgi:hypothetical protein
MSNENVKEKCINILNEERSTLIGSTIIQRKDDNEADDWQTILRMPLSCRHKDLVERSFILGVVKADSSRTRKRKRILRDENEKEIESFDITRMNDEKAKATDSDTTQWMQDVDFCSPDNSLIQEIQQTIIEW